MTGNYFSDVKEQWHTLQYQARQTQGLSLAPSTRANYRSAFRAFCLFCVYFGLVPLPTSLDTLVCFVQFLSRSFTSAQAIENYVSAIRYVHRWNFQKCDFDLENFCLKDTLRGLNRFMARPPTQKLPITPAILHQLLANLDLTCDLGCVLKAAFTINFFTFARKANLVPPSHQQFDPRKQLSRGSIRVTPVGLLVSMHWSKTNQFQKKVIHIPLAPIPGSILCPVQAYLTMVSRIPAPLESPAFVIPSSQGLQSLTHSSYSKFLRLALRKLGIPNVDCYSGHSFRRGGATWAFSANVPSELIKEHGDWLSEAYLRYLNFNLEERLVVTLKMGQAVTKLGL